MRDDSRSQQSRAGVAGMVLAGVVSGCLLVWFTGDRFFNSDARESTILVQHTVLVCAIAGALWLTGKRPWRAYALSLFVFWAVIWVLAALAWNDPEGAGSPGGSRGCQIGGCSGPAAFEQFAPRATMLTREGYRLPRPNMRPNRSPIDLAGLMSTRVDPSGSGRFAACSEERVVPTWLV